MAVRLWAKGQARKKADPEGDSRARGRERGVRGLAVRPVLTVSGLCLRLAVVSNLTMGSVPIRSLDPINQ